MKRGRMVIAPLLAVGVAVATGGWLGQRHSRTARGSGEHLFGQVLEYVAATSADAHSPAELYRMATGGMVDVLGDPHSAYLTPEQYARLHVQTTGEYAGLGITIGRHEGWITAVGVLPGTPSDRAGIRVGDRLVAVDGRSTDGWTPEEMVANLRGGEGQAVVLGVRSTPSGPARDVRMVREEIHVRSVPYAYLLGDGIGYANLTVFSQTSTDELRAAVQRLRGEGMRSLVLDLRGNPGGLLDQGVSVADLFLPPGEPIVETRGRDPRENERFAAQTPEAFDGLPVVVLVDDYTASAAEIVAGALQDHDRALVLGAPSYGKGSVQSLFPLSGGSFLKLTTARWYTPSGRSIQKNHPVSSDGGEEDEDAVEETVDTTAAADTVRRAVFHTDAGRVVYGGGGIVPDVVVGADTADAASRAFVAAAAKAATRFDDVVFRYGVEYARSHPELPRQFAVTREMRTDLTTRLKAAGIDATPQQFRAAAGLLDRRLAHEVALSRWGSGAAERRDGQTDPVIGRAVRLLRAVPTQEALFRAAAAQAPTRR
jgi:carboxyl-terminal processing protease